MQKKFSTVLFDLDGTLLDTLADLADAVNYALHEMGYPAHTYDEIRMYLGNGVAMLMKRAVPTGTSPEDTDRALAIFKERYAAHDKDKTAPYPGIPDLLRALHDRGVKTAVISNKFDAAVKVLNRTYFGDLIPVAIGENEAAGIKKKPDPASVFAAMEELGVKKENCIYVGDSDVDLLTAENAGIPCIGCAWGFRGKTFLLQHGADPALIAETPADILDLL